ncbi:hypothetical protein PMI12_02379 [Variovorax sp. CF313]|nr:hypothetical protein PMI12_02379 [Variovorax sp. CF313]
MVFSRQLHTLALCAGGIACPVEGKGTVRRVETLRYSVFGAIDVIQIQTCGTGRSTKPCKLSTRLSELFLEQLNEGIPAVLGRLSWLARHHGAGRDRGRSPQAAEQAHQERPERLQDSAQPAGAESDRSEFASLTFDCCRPGAIEIDAGGRGRHGGLLRHCIEPQRVLQRWTRGCSNRWRRCRGGGCRWIGDAHGLLLVVVERDGDRGGNMRFGAGEELIDDRRRAHGRRLALAAGLWLCRASGCWSCACAACTLDICSCAQAHVAAPIKAHVTAVTTVGVKTAQSNAMRRRWRAFRSSVVVCPWLNSICARSACSCSWRSVDIRAVA